VPDVIAEVTGQTVVVVNVVKVSVAVEPEVPVPPE
jgi:hypothetical protein